jgi:alkaline phosphatase D
MYLFTMAAPSTTQRLLAAMLLSLVSLSPKFSVTADTAVDFEHPDTVLETLAFGSCHKRKRATTTPATIWSVIRSDKPDAWLWTGDAVYPPYKGVATTAQLVTEYRQMKENATLGYADFAPPAGIYGTWDDHDYGGNDMGREMSGKQERASAFWDFLGHAAPAVDRQGVYSAVSWGSAPQKVLSVQLDTRWHRANHCVPSFATSLPLGAGIACVTRWLSAGLLPRLCSPESQLLGAEQWAWLEEQLQSTDASMIVIVSSIQVFTTNPVMESWGHFPVERDRLVRLLAAASEDKGVVLLSGDVHHAEILDPAAGTAVAAQSFLEVTSSGLTHDCSMPFYGAMCEPLLEKFKDHRFENSGNYYIGLNYGTMHIDWTAKTFTVDVRNVSGESVLTTGARPFGTAKWSEQDLEQVAPCMDGHLMPMAWTTLLGAVVLLASVVLQRQMQ